VQNRKERKRQDKLAKYNQAINQRDFLASQHYESPAVKKTMLKSAGFNPALDTSAQPSAPAEGSPVSVPQSDTSALGSAISAGGAVVAENLARSEDLRLKDEANKIEKAKSEAVINQIVNNLCVSPQSLASYIKRKQGRGEEAVFYDGMAKWSFDFDANGGISLLTPCSVDGVALSLPSSSAKVYSSDELKTFGFKNVVDGVDYYVKDYSDFAKDDAVQLGLNSMLRVDKEHIANLMSGTEQRQTEANEPYSGTNAEHASDILASEATKGRVEAKYAEQEKQISLKLQKTQIGLALSAEMNYKANTRQTNLLSDLQEFKNAVEELGATNSPAYVRKAISIYLRRQQPLEEIYQALDKIDEWHAIQKDIDLYSNIAERNDNAVRQVTDAVKSISETLESVGDGVQSLNPRKPSLKVKPKNNNKRNNNNRNERKRKMTNAEREAEFYSRQKGH
jgi:hypothetical protein